MRRLTSAMCLFVLINGTAACGSDEPITMPEVVGKRLDIALSDIERSGVEDEVEILGGGTFGVLDETNWTVCSQEPETGGDVTAPPRISVDRSCDGGDSIDPTDDGSQESGTTSANEQEDTQASPKPKARKKPKARPGGGAADTFVMPLLVGMNLQKAQNVLQRHGSYLLTQTDGTGQARFQMVDYNWKVCAQDPPAGVPADGATLVELVTVKLSESC